MGTRDRQEGFMEEEIFPMDLEELPTLWQTDIPSSRN